MHVFIKCKNENKFIHQFSFSLPRTLCPSNISRLESGAGGSLAGL